MFDHVTLRPSDRAASERFYDTIPATLGMGWRDTPTEQVAFAATGNAAVHNR